MSRYYDYDTLCKGMHDVVLKNGALHRCIDDIKILDLPTADVVEADKAQKEIDYWHDKAQSYEQTILKLSLSKADVVEVVRCKDCKKYNTDDCMMIHGKKMNRNIFANDFCSYGERK